MSEKDPTRIKQRGKEAMRDGRYAEALAEYDWYWRYALAHQPSQAGVRLSFFLSDVEELADVFPAAADQMDEWREEARMTLLQAGADAASLDDYVALAVRAGAVKELGETLTTLHEREAPVFTQNARNHWQKLVENDLLELAREYKPDVEREVRLLNDYLNHSKVDSVAPRSIAITTTARRIDRFFRNLEKLEIGGLIDGAIQLMVDTIDDETLEALTVSMKPGSYHRRQLREALDS